MDALKVFGADYLKPATLSRLEVLEQATPNLTWLDMDLAYGIGVGRPFTLTRLKNVVASDSSFHDLDQLTRCDFPAVESMTITVDVDELGDEDRALATMKRLFGEGFAPALRRLSFCIFYQNEPSRRFIDLLARSTPELLQRRSLEKVTLPRVFDGREEEQIEELLGDKLG